MRNIVATIIGFIAASVTVYIIENLIGHNLFPLPDGADPLNMDWLSNNMNKIPVGIKICVVIAHFTGVLIGMFVAAKISKTSMVPSYIVGALMLAATFFNIIMLPKELWFTLSDGVFAIIGFYLGHVVASKTINKPKAIHKT
ncbi:hypothetical protein [Winogradskyella thalassocola]|uniref:Uncharacterized protein n=1 Tax=Winogradskyella thalassocola TaxID=262004 RepID=A0A1G8HD70_9FLAO|nr:hypothetical protein [Winogradskyella thalassocola]SDI04617.1 hypothetical protein SAMN04489796_106196 [Winogradskyella thalassocola]